MMEYSQYFVPSGQFKMMDIMSKKIDRNKNSVGCNNVIKKWKINVNPAGM
jgi:hypothetical protein